MELPWIVTCLATASIHRAARGVGRWVLECMLVRGLLTGWYLQSTVYASVLLLSLSEFDTSHQAVIRMEMGPGFYLWRTPEERGHQKNG